ncbi:MAG TPA: DJ-1/PfpI family protein [Cytophagaceae bacterium]|jgi:catalase|nr:DJ-1/PfpI family protein [Cytophagaceae bacterium]
MRNQLLEMQAKGKQVAIMAANGVDEGSLFKMKFALEQKGLQTKIISTEQESISSSQGKQIKVDQNVVASFPMDFDAVYVPGGEDSIFALQTEPGVIQFINEVFKNSKPIAVDGEGEELLYVTAAGEELNNGKAEGVLINRASKEFVQAIAQHELWLTEKPQRISA